MDLFREYTLTCEITGGYLFRRLHRGGQITESGLSPRSIRQIINAVFARWQPYTSLADREVPISGHSLWIGTARSLVAAGGNLPEVMQAGRWQSSRMPAHYAKRERAQRNAVARLLAD